MTGFTEYFGWTCSPNDVGCIPATQSKIDVDQGLINGLFGAGATIGAILSPWLADTYGRKVCLFSAATLFIFGAGMQAGAQELIVLQIGRIFSGWAIGSLSMCAPVYISELAPEHTRGMLSTLWQVAITAGILIASTCNLGLERWDQGWRLSYGGNIIFAFIMMGALFFMPESPRWLAGMDHDDLARQALIRVRYEDEVESEVKKLKQETREEKVLAVPNKMRYRVFLGIGLQVTQQLSGINAIMFYAPTILGNFFSNRNAIIGTFVLNFINFISTFITVYTVERAGRVRLLVSGGCIMTAALVVNAILSSLDQTKTVGYVVLLFAAIYIVGFAFSWGPVVWTVCAEMFPLRARGKATGLTTMSNWAMTTIVGATFPTASTASLSGCFGFFSCIILIGTIMVYFFEAETAKKTISEIDEAYNKHKPALYRKKW
jgi:sugar porter (SP) family MFS transporter